VQHATRTNQSVKTDVRIALWHFDKKVLNAVSALDNEKPHIIPRTMDLDEATEHNLFHRQGGNIYSTADTVKVERTKCMCTVIALVPTCYSIVEANNDVIEATAGYNTFAAREKVNSRAPTRVPRTSSIGSNNTSNVSPSSTSSNDSPTSEQRRTKRQKRNEAFTCLSNEEFFILTRAKQESYLDKLRKEMKQDGQGKVRLGHLLSTLPSLEHALKQDAQTLKNCKSKIDLMKKNQDNQKGLMDELQALEAIGGWLNRISFTSKEGIGKNEMVCKELYGFSDFDFMINFLEAAFEIEYIKPGRATVGAGGDRTNGLSDVEQVMLTLVFTNTLWNYDLIGIMLGIKSRKTVQNYIKKWMPLLGERGDVMSSFLIFMDGNSFDQLEQNHTSILI